MSRLVRDGLLSPSWKNNKYKGIVSRSVVVFVVRKGNPKHVKTWDDLVKSGVKVVVPNPLTSGGARWAILSGYGAERRYGKTDKQAQAHLQTLFKSNIVSQDKSARDALNTFLAGKGDVLLTYENEAILAQQKGQALFYVIPKATLRIDTPIAVLDKSQNKPLAQAFVNFLYSEPAQEIWGSVGYRPVDKTALAKFKFPVRPWLFTIDSPFLGGWAKANTRFFDPQNGIVTKIEQNLG
jgi:sulfate transport system substrate-binding protein